MKTLKEIREKSKKTPEQEFYSGKHIKGPSQISNVSPEELEKLRKMFVPSDNKKLNELACPPGIQKVRYKGTLGRKDMMVCPRRSGSSAGSNGNGGE